MEEIWMPIPGYGEKYSASSFGRIRSERQVVMHCPKGIWMERVIQARVLKTSSDAHGYKRTNLTLNKISRPWLVHRLIAMTFLPNPISLPCVNHIDACKFNNRIENLEWVTHAENMAHAARLGIMASNSGPGMESPAAKLTDSDVIEIKRRLSLGHRAGSISMDYPVSESAIREIKAGRSWSHIDI